MQICWLIKVTKNLTKGTNCLTSETPLQFSWENDNDTQSLGENLFMIVNRKDGKIVCSSFLV